MYTVTLPAEPEPEKPQKPKKIYKRKPKPPKLDEFGNVIVPNRGRPPGAKSHEIIYQVRLQTTLPPIIKATLLGDAKQKGITVSELLTQIVVQKYRISTLDTGTQPRVRRKHRNQIKAAYIKRLTLQIPQLKKLYRNVENEIE